MPLVAGLMSVGLGLSAGCGAAAGGPSGASGRAASSAAPSPGGSSGRPDMTAPAGSAAGRTTNVPMKVVREGRAVLEIVPVSINGSGPYDFLLDTGSAVSSVDKALAARLRLRTTGKTEHVRGVTGSAEVSLTRIGRWKLGPLALAPRTSVSWTSRSGRKEV